MVSYMAKKIDLSKVNNINEYWDAVKHASIHYCNGLEELRQYCGGHLHRQRNGYSGTNGNIEYVAQKC